MYIVLSKSPSSVTDAGDAVSPDIKIKSNTYTESRVKVVVNSETKIEKISTSKSETETNSWSKAEIFKFFELYKKYYKDFQSISINMNSRTKDQVRQFYYRLVTKITTMLQKYGHISEELRIKEKNVLLITSLYSI